MRERADRPPAGVGAEGLERAGRSVADRERLRQHLVCIGLLEFAGVAYTVAYFDNGFYGFGVDHRRLHGARRHRAARRLPRPTSSPPRNLVSGSLFLVIVSTSYASGGVAQAGYAWIYVVPLVAGLLGGVRCLVIWGSLALFATLTMCCGGIGPLRVTMDLPDAFAAWQGVFDIVLIFMTIW